MKKQWMEALFFISIGLIYISTMMAAMVQNSFSLAVANMVGFTGIGIGLAIMLAIGVTIVLERRARRKR